MGKIIKMVGRHALGKLVQIQETVSEAMFSKIMLIVSGF